MPRPRLSLSEVEHSSGKIGDSSGDSLYPFFIGCCFFFPADQLTDRVANIYYHFVQFTNVFIHFVMSPCVWCQAGGRGGQLFSQFSDFLFLTVLSFSHFGEYIGKYVHFPGHHFKLLLVVGCWAGDKGRRGFLRRGEVGAAAAACVGTPAICSKC